LLPELHNSQKYNNKTDVEPVAPLRLFGWVAATFDLGLGCMTGLLRTDCVAETDMRAS